MPNKAEEIIDNNDEIGAYTALGLPLIERAVQQGYSTLSGPELLFISVYQLDMDVNNGGFYSYFCGPSADHAADALRGLEQIGARHIHSLLAQACSVFPGGDVPRTQGERETFLHDRSDDRWADLDKPNRSKEVFERLDREFYASADQLIKLVVDFAREHIKDFNIT